QATEVVMPTALDSGSQNTENPYAMPMHRWIASAAGGTSQRLNAGPAMIRSLVRNPVDDTNGTDDIGETPCLIAPSTGCCGAVYGQKSRERRLKSDEVAEKTAKM